MKNNSYNRDDSGLTEEMLFHRYAHGDASAFEEILRRTQGLVFSLIFHYTSSRAIAEEIFQEVFLKVCKNKDLFRESISFKSWLVTICKNTCIDYTRRVKRRLKTETLDDYSDNTRNLHETVADDRPGPDEGVLLGSESRELAGWLQKLPVEQRETFMMKIAAEMTFEEIGEAMACSPNTAKSRYRYALETLRGLVKRTGRLKGISSEGGVI